MTLQPGTKLGDYEITGQLGQGGMGTVYRAFDTTLQRPVAIKVLSEADEQARSKLLAEARAASALSHPNVATVFEVGEDDGQPYIVMELVEGKPLSELVPSDGLPPESVIRYGLQIADALAHAHEKGIIHRDLKSQNVVVTPEGRAKVLDFGLATRLEKQDAEAVTVSMDTRADVGRIAGTLAYMAPEVLRGEEATARSDIWALGVLLYELASGLLPFGGPTKTDVVSAIVTQSPASLPARVSAGLKAIVLRCLAKDPLQRYSSAAVVQGALEAIQSDAAMQPRSVSARKTASWRWVIGFLGIILIAGALGYWLRPGAESTQPTGSAVPRFVSPVQLTRATTVEDYPAWSPDGRSIVYQSNQTGNWDVWIAQIGGGPPLNRTADSPSDDRLPSWSPDGGQIAFMSNRDGRYGLYVMPVLAGPARLVTTELVPAGGPSAPQWSSDGMEIAFRGSLGDDRWVVVTSLEDGETRRVPLPTGGVDFSRSADGDYIAMMPDNHSYEVRALLGARLSDGATWNLTNGRWRDQSPTWSRDGRHLFFVSNRGGAMDLWRQRLSSDRRPEGEPEALTAGLGLYHAVFSADESKLAYSNWKRIANVWRVPILDDRLAGWEDAEQLTFDAAFIEHVDVAPDGTQLVVSSDRSGNADLWLLPASGGDMEPLTTHPSPDAAPRWSPDGQTVAFETARGGEYDVWLIDAQGGSARPLTTPGDGGRNFNEYPDWSPDGREIIVKSGRERPINMWNWVEPVEGGEARRVTDYGGSLGTEWSPTGEWFAQARRDEANRTILRLWLTSVETGEPRLIESVPNALANRWAPDGRSLYYVAQNVRSSLWQVLVDDGRRNQLADLSGRRGRLGAEALATDGSYLYFTWEEVSSDIWVMDVVQDEP